MGTLNDQVASKVVSNEVEEEKGGLEAAQNLCKWPSAFQCSFPLLLLLRETNLNVKVSRGGSSSTPEEGARSRMG